MNEFVSPDLEVVDISVEDIITTSGTNSDLGKEELPPV